MDDDNFDYNLDEIVQMDGKGLVSLRTALIHMPDACGHWTSYIARPARHLHFSMPGKSSRS